MKCCVCDWADSNKVEERYAISMMRCVCYYDNNDTMMIVWHIMHVCHAYIQRSVRRIFAFYFYYHKKFNSAD